MVVPQDTCLRVERPDSSSGLMNRGSFLALVGRFRGCVTGGSTHVVNLVYELLAAVPRLLAYQGSKRYLVFPTPLISDTCRCLDGR